MDESLVKIRHERSKRDFPWLKIDDDEYVEFAFRRAKSRLNLTIGGVVFGLIVILLVFLLVLNGQSMLDEMAKNFLFVILLVMVSAAIIMGVIAVKVYRGNWLIITNKRVIQMVQRSLLSSSVNVIDLASVEDVSFRQDVLTQRIFGYGTMRLSTVGDETTYTFPYADIKAEELDAISKLVSQRKEAKKKAID